MQFWMQKWKKNAIFVDPGLRKQTKKFLEMFV